MSEEKLSKSTRLIYIIIFLWVYFAAIGLIYEANLAQLAGYYASLTLFVSTFLWGEYKRQSSKTGVFKKGMSSSREITIYVTVLLWVITGTLGVFFGVDINTLTVYFAALTPFVSSYLIYKTSKGADLPIFDGESQQIKNNSMENAGVETIERKEKPTPPPIVEENHIENQTIEQSTNFDEDVEDEVF